MEEWELRRRCCCFTGHRPEKLDMTEAEMERLLETAVRDAIAGQFTTFISGCAKGADLCAAEIVLKLREDNPQLKLICAVPYAGFGTHWRDGWTKRFRRVTAEADQMRYICEAPGRSVFQRRNRWMVDHAGLVIAVYQGRSGGTRNTLEYAQKSGVPCVILGGTP